MRCLLSLLGVFLFSAAWATDFRAADYGAKGDGVSDDSPAIQRALNAAGAEDGGRVLLDARRYRLENGLRVPSGVSLSGVWEGPHFSNNGTVLLAVADRGDPDGPALIRLSPNATVKGLTVYYPDQRLEKVVEYPWTIQGQGTNGNVIDVTLVNPVRGIDFGTHPNELHYIRNVFGCPLKTGIYIDQTSDIGRVENVHFNPNFWDRTGLPNAPKKNALIAYLTANLTAFELGRSDWQAMSNTFSYGAKVGYRFFRSKYGMCTGNFMGIAADWATTAVLVEQTRPAGLLITNGQFVGNRQTPVLIDVRGTHDGVVSFSNCNFWGPQQRTARVDGKGRVQFNSCLFVYWDDENKGLPAIEAVSGMLDVSHCFFKLDKPQVKLAGSVKAVITGNQMAGDLRITNDSSAAVSISGNIAKNTPPSPE